MCSLKCNFLVLGNGRKVCGADDVALKGNETKFPSDAHGLKGSAFRHDTWPSSLDLLVLVHTNRRVCCGD